MLYMRPKQKLRDGKGERKRILLKDTARKQMLCDLHIFCEEQLLLSHLQREWKRKGSLIREGGALTQVRKQRTWCSVACISSVKSNSHWPIKENVYTSNGKASNLHVLKDSLWLVACWRQHLGCVGVEGSIWVVLIWPRDNAQSASLDEPACIFHITWSDPLFIAGLFKMERLKSVQEIAFCNG